MKALVTGGCGFIGQHLVEKLVAGGVEVVCLDINDVCATGYKKVKKLLKDKLIVGDVCDQKILNQIIPEVDIVYHLAAQSHVDVSISNPLGSMHTNAVGTQMVASACAMFDKALVYCSTDEVYGDNELDIPYSEGMKLEPSSPYSAGKAAGEFAVTSAARSLGLRKWAITRGCNAFGQNQYTEKLIPIACSLIQKGLPVTVHNSGRQVRQWVAVEEFCDGLITVGQSVLSKTIDHYPIYNIAGPRRMSVLDLILRIDHVANGKIRNVSDVCTFVGDRPGQDNNYNVSGENAQRKLGFKPVRDIFSMHEIQRLLDCYGPEIELNIADYRSTKKEREYATPCP